MKNSANSQAFFKKVLECILPVGGLISGRVRSRAVNGAPAQREREREREREKGRQEFSSLLISVDEFAFSVHVGENKEQPRC